MTSRLVVALCLLWQIGSTLVSAQEPSVGFGLHRMLAGGAGIERTCLEPAYPTGFAARYAHPVFSRLTSVELTATFHYWGQDSNCVNGFPPPDGTYIQDDRRSLLATPFTSTNLRLRARLRPDRLTPSLAVGAGTTWRAGHNLPYALAELRLPMLPLRTVRVHLEGEALYVRVAADRYRRTFQNFQLTLEESLGRVYHWTHALTLGLLVEIPVPAPLR